MSALSHLQQRGGGTGHGVNDRADGMGSGTSRDAPPAPLRALNPPLIKRRGAAPGAKAAPQLGTVGRGGDKDRALPASPGASQRGPATGGTTHRPRGGSRLPSAPRCSCALTAP